MSLLAIVKGFETLIGTSDSSDSLSETRLELIVEVFSMLEGVKRLMECVGAVRPKYLNKNESSKLLVLVVMYVLPRQALGSSALLHSETRRLGGSLLSA